MIIYGRISKFARMKSKSRWTPSAQTITKKADTRYRKRLKTADERHRRLVARHTRLARDIINAVAVASKIKKEGVVLTPAEKVLKAKEEAKVARIIMMHDQEHQSFATIGKALKMSHAWAHALYIQHKVGAKPKAKKKAIKKVVKAKKAAPKKKKVASKKLKPITKVKATKSPSSSPKKHRKMAMMRVSKEYKAAISKLSTEDVAKFLPKKQTKGVKYGAALPKKKAVANKETPTISASGKWGDDDEL